MARSSVVLPAPLRPAMTVHPSQDPSARWKLSVVSPANERMFSMRKDVMCMACEEGCHTPRQGATAALSRLGTATSGALRAVPELCARLRSPRARKNRPCRALCRGAGSPGPRFLPMFLLFFSARKAPARRAKASARRAWPCSLRRGTRGLPRPCVLRGHGQRAVRGLSPGPLGQDAEPHPWPLSSFVERGKSRGNSPSPLAGEGGGGG